MNVEQLRQTLKVKWLCYYRDNRSWITRLAVWVTCDGNRRPSSSFILASLSVLEPQLNQLFPLVVELSNNPDRVVAALGLNFNPDDELKAIEARRGAALASKSQPMLPSGGEALTLPAQGQPVRVKIPSDEACRGTGTDRDS